MSDFAEDFFETMLTFFPSLLYEYEKHIEKCNERLDTVIMEDIFMPEIIKLLNDNSDYELLKSIFEYFEKVSTSSDKYFLNVFSITVMEILGNDKKILEIAKQYMGPKTVQLQREADKALGRPLSI
ncbi:MAG: resolvase [Lachnospiraceae bacterium]|nr:resolvase [Lachnospiraceae bacterium]